ncbi:MAG: hypothetical protein ACREH6_07760 [Geminicoccaceae bacterium]
MQPSDSNGGRQAEPEGDRAVPTTAAEHGLQRLALDLLTPADGLIASPQGLTGPEPSGEPGRASVLGIDHLVLALDQVIADGNDEVVFVNDAGLAHVAVSTDVDVVAQGTAIEHVTADGQDVSGFAFVTFASGMTLFYPDGVDLALVPTG